MERLRNYLISLLSRGKQLAHVTEQEVMKEIKALSLSGVLTSAEAKQLKRMVLEEIKQEKKQVHTFLREEVKGVKKRAMPVVRSVAHLGKSVAKRTAKRVVKRAEKVVSHVLDQKSKKTKR